VLCVPTHDFDFDCVYFECIPRTRAFSHMYFLLFYFIILYLCVFLYLFKELLAIQRLVYRMGREGLQKLGFCIKPF
jgi:hypothetical protein